MKRQIPVNVQQTFPSDWEKTFTSTTPIPTEEQLTRSDSMDDDFYNDDKLEVNTKALVYAAMHAFNSFSSIPEISFENTGSFNKVFCISFPAAGPDGTEFRVAARLPMKIARAPGRIETIAAMMLMARYVRGIPVPEVYAWYPESDNPVGAPYILLEWVEGIEPWRQWYDYRKEEKTRFMEQLVEYHAKFAEPLPFKGMGSICFAETHAARELPLDDVASYRLGPLSRGPTCTVNRDISSWPQSTPTSLRDFWRELWQHEVDYITSMHGTTDRSALIATEDHPSHDIDEDVTLGEFLDLASAVRVLIERCVLPSVDAHPSLYYPSFVSTDYAFRNMKMDPETRKITASLDWDDVYVMPFLLCSRYPEDICRIDGSGKRWHSLGGFLFLPLDEEGEIEEEEAETVPEKTEEMVEEGSEAEDEEDGSEPSASEEEEEESGSDDDGKGNEHSSQSPKVEEPPIEFDTESESYYDYRRRIQDTRLRREYEQLLIARDPRFGFEGFWKMREDPLKIQQLVTHGWIEWLNKAEWVKERATELELEQSS